MSQPQSCTLTISYDGIRHEVSFPENTKYEDFIKSTMEYLKIPMEVVEYVKITPGGGYILTKEAFENFIMFNPEPEITLKIFVSDTLEDPNVELSWQQRCRGRKEAREPQLKRQRFNYS